ncbi:MAG: lipid-binding SYLF domain-containing protein [Pirellulaceae bacterium]
MAKHLSFAIVAVLALHVMSPTAAWAQARETRILQNSTEVLNEFMSLRMKGIPRALLADAQGIAIIPGMVKAGFVIGGRHGTGALVIRDEHGDWRMPVFISLTGGNIGYQIGVQSTDLVLVFKTQKSISGILDGKLTLGVDAAAAAGPVGREAGAATDGQLGAEIYSYSRSRGLFAGVSVDGSVLQVAQRMNDAYYSSRPETLRETDPAVVLVSKIASYGAVDGAPIVEQGAAQPDVETLPSPAGQPTPQVLREPSFTPGGQPSLAPPQNVDPTETLRQRLSASAAGMSKLLDPSWRQYLALPAQVYETGARPNAEALQQSLTRFESVAADPRYGALNARGEFRGTLELLQQYSRAINESDTALRLPAPPAAGGSSSVLRPR